MAAPSHPTCVFCGNPLTETDAVAGRPPHAAHAACADTALADDSHWDEIASMTPDAEEADPGEPPEAPPAAGRGGCLGVIAVPAALALIGVARRRGSQSRR